MSIKEKLDSLKLTNAFLVDVVPPGAHSRYEITKDKRMIVANQGMIETFRSKDDYVNLPLMNEELLTDDLLFRIIDAASSNRVTVKQAAQYFEDLDVSIDFIIKHPSSDFEAEDLKPSFLVKMIMIDWPMAQIISYEDCPKNEIIIGSREYATRLSVYGTEEFGILVFNPSAIVKCDYISSKLKN